MLYSYGPLYGASAIGANNLLRYAAGGVAPLYTRQMYAKLGISVSSLSSLGLLKNVAEPHPAVGCQLAGLHYSRLDPCAIHSIQIRREDSCEEFVQSKVNVI